MTSLTESCTRRSLNDKLVGFITNQSIGSYEALLNFAQDTEEYRADREQGAIVAARVWNDRDKLFGSASDFERRLIMQADSRCGANAVVLLMDLRGRWRKDATFALSSRAKNRPITPELGRDAFDRAVQVLLKTGCLIKVRNSLYSPQGDHAAALYQLGPRREDGALPEPAKKRHRLQVAVHQPVQQPAVPVAHQEPPPAMRGTQPEPQPPTAPSRLLTPQTEEERDIIASWRKCMPDISDEMLCQIIEGERSDKAEEARHRAERSRPKELPETLQRIVATPEAADAEPEPAADYTGFTPEELAAIRELNASQCRFGNPPLNREEALNYLARKPLYGSCLQPAH